MSDAPHQPGEPGEPGEPGDVPDQEGEDQRVEALIARLARPHASGGRVIERASLMSAGHDFDAAIAWIEAHGGEPEMPAAAPARGGLHSARPSPGRAGPTTPLRFVLPTTAREIP